MHDDDMITHDLGSEEEAMDGEGLDLGDEDIEEESDEEDDM